MPKRSKRQRGSASDDESSDGTCKTRLARRSARRRTPPASSATSAGTAEDTDASVGSVSEPRIAESALAELPTTSVGREYEAYSAFWLAWQKELPSRKQDREDTRAAWHASTADAATQDNLPVAGEQADRELDMQTSEALRNGAMSLEQGLFAEMTRAQCGRIAEALKAASIDLKGISAELDRRGGGDNAPHVLMEYECRKEVHRRWSEMLEGSEDRLNRQTIKEISDGADAYFKSLAVAMKNGKALPKRSGGEWHFFLPDERSEAESSLARKRTESEKSIETFRELRDATLEQVKVNNDQAYDLELEAAKAQDKAYLWRSYERFVRQHFPEESGAQSGRSQ